MSEIEGQIEPARPEMADRRRSSLAERRPIAVLAPLAVVVVILGSWELTSRFVSPVLISSPQRTATDFVQLLQDGTAEAALAISVKELYLGLAIGLVAGILIGILVGRYQIVESVLGPFINVANATPLNILLPLLILWVGISVRARVLFIVLITLFPVLLNTAGGLRNVSRGYVEVGRTLGLSERQLLWKVILPASVPYIFAGVRIGTALAVVGMIVGEMEVSNVGIGYLLNFYGEGFQTGKLLALVVMASIIGVVNVMAVRGTQERWFKWITEVR